MYCLSVYLIKIQSYHAFSKTAVDHWCLSLRIDTGGWAPFHDSAYISESI